MRRKKGGKAGFENPYCGPSIQLIFGEKKKNTKYKTCTYIMLHHKTRQRYIREISIAMF